MNFVAEPPDLAVPRRALHRGVRIGLFILLTVIVLVGLSLAAFTIAMARVPAYRAQMQTWISEHAKLDIQFDSLRAGWRGYGPELVFTHAILRSVDQQRVVVVAEQGSVGFDLWQALRTGRLIAARFRLEGTELKLQRDKNGSFAFIGQEDWPDFAAERSFKLDSLPVGELEIRRVTFSFRDLKTGRGPWTLQDVSLDIGRDAQQFTVQGYADLPAVLGKTLRFEAQGKGNLNVIAQLDWQASVQGTGLDLAGWKQVMPDDWPAPELGTGSFQLYASFVGAQPQQFTGSINFVDVALKLPQWQLPLPQADALQRRADDPDVQVVEQAVEALPVIATAEQLRYSNVALQFSSSHTPQGWATNFSNLQLSRPGSPWPASTASVLLKAGSEDALISRPVVVEVKAQVLVLENLWPLLAYLPETEAYARWRALYASGQLRNLAIRYERDSQEGEAAEPRYGVQLEFIQLGLAPVGKTPGITGLSGTASGTGARGSVQLDSSDVSLSIPRLFRTPLPVDGVTGNVVWTRNTQGVQLHTDDLAINNADGGAQARLTLTVPRSGSVLIDMQATATNLAVAATPRYLPAGVMRKRTLAWMDAAFPQGKVTQAQAVLRGPLDKFPYRNQEGEFLVKAQLEGLSMHYQDGWLPATGLQVAAEFHNAGLTAVATAGRINGLYLDHAEGHIEDFRDAKVFITATSHGDLAQGLSFVQQSPVGPAIGELFQRLSGSGALEAKSSLYLPLQQFDNRKIDIDISLSNAIVRMAGVQQPASQVRGSLHIANDAVTAADLSGRFLQGDFTVRAEPLTAGRYNLVANGSLQAQPLAQFLSLPTWIKLSGSTDYHYIMPGYAQRDAQGTRHLYGVISDLQGLQIDLPKPVNKPAGVARSLRIDADMPSQDSMQLRASLGDLRALVRLQLNNNTWQFERGGVRADAVAAALPAHAGLRIDGHLASFTLDDWLQLGGGTTIKTDSKANATEATRVQDVLRAANVTIDRFYLYGFEWPSLRAVLQATDDGWRVDLAGEQAAGQVLVPYVLTTGTPLTLNMESLWLTPRTGDKLQPAKNKSTIDPRELPAIKADIQRFRYGEHDFGTLHGVASRVVQGLQVDALRISDSSFTGAGTGSWLQTVDGSLSTLALTLESTDVRATLRQLNYGEFIAAKRGKLVANLQWPDGLDENLLGRSSGTLTVQVDEGQLLNVEPGAGRVLGLLSIAALPRRLGLDFRDLTDKGLSFDSVHGDFTVTNGDARTQNLLLRGATAEIGIVGRLGLGARDYDQTAVVTGNVTGALPVAAVVAGGPVIGAAMLLFSQVFKEPLKGVARAYYHIGGGWDDPQVERIDADAAKASLSDADASLPQ